MPPKRRIAVEGVGGVKLSNDHELDKRLNKKSVECLRDSRGGGEVVGFESLVNGGKYTLGPPQKQQGPEAKKRPLEDLLFYHRAAIETSTSKSSKLVKVKKLDNGRTRCFLCGASGTHTDKIEATYVLQKQHLYATGARKKRCLL